MPLESEPRYPNKEPLLFSANRNINERFGKIQIKIKSGIGSYTIAVLNDKDKPLPVLSTANEYVTNAFFLKNSKKTYNLITL